MDNYKTSYCGLIPEGSIKYLQQHKSVRKDSEYKYFFWSESKHQMTDMFTVAIWTIKLKSK